MQPSLAVVVPTYNRRSALEQCLGHLERQTRQDFQVVVVDDGSTDGTEEWIAAYRHRTPLQLQYLRQANSGPSRARNAAMTLVGAPVTALIGDDIFVGPNWVAMHLGLHDSRPQEQVAGLGLTVWAERGQVVTRFMRWLDSGGTQFNYGELLAGAAPDWKHFYTSNLSLKTSLLRRFPFDESFQRYGMEDIELACRIDDQNGLEMVFLKDAMAEHLHPMTFAGACRRMESVGEASAHFDRLCPGRLPRGAQSSIFRAGERLARLPMVLPLMEWAAGQSVRFACPNKLMTFVLNHHFHAGYSRYRAAAD